MKRLQFIKQPDSYGCGPVALYNLLIFNKVKSNLSELYSMCNTDRYGTAKRDFIKALDKLGLKYTQGLFRKSKCKLTALFLQNKLECGIIGYYAGNEGHYSMFYKEGSKIVITNSESDDILSKKSYKNLKTRKVVSLDWWIDKSTSSATEIYYIRRKK